MSVTARSPEDLDRLFLDRANSGDVEGIVALYEEPALLVGPDGPRLTTRDELRQLYRSLLDGSRRFDGEVRPALRLGELALTSTRFRRAVPGAAPLQSATAEVARRQPDGSWLWVIDQPDVLG